MVDVTFTGNTAAYGRDVFLGPAATLALHGCDLGPSTEPEAAIRAQASAWVTAVGLTAADLPLVFASDDATLDITGARVQDTGLVAATNSSAVTLEDVLVQGSPGPALSLDASTLVADELAVSGATGSAIVTTGGSPVDLRDSACAYVVGTDPFCIESPSANAPLTYENVAHIGHGLFGFFDPVQFRRGTGRVGPNAVHRQLASREHRGP